MLRPALAVAALAIAYLCYRASDVGSYWVVPLYVLAYGTLLIAVFWPRTPYGVRAGILVLLVYVIAVTDLLGSGWRGDGRLLLFAAPLIATLLLGKRGGIVALVLDAVIVGVLGWAFVSGLVDVSLEQRTDYASPFVWIGNLLVLLALGGGLIAAAQYLVTSLKASLAWGSELETANDALVRRAEVLETSNAVLAGRAEALWAVALAVREAVSASPDEVLARVATLISDRCQFDHVGIFVMDGGGEWAVLRAAASDGGLRMLARRHRLRVGEEGIVGQVTDRGEPHVAMDVGTDVVFYENPDLPDTRSELAVPLLHQGRVIGALDIQEPRADAFTDTDITMVQTLADLVVVGLERAGSFEQEHESSATGQDSPGELGIQPWMERVSSNGGIGYRFERGSVTRVTEPRDRLGDGVDDQTETLPELTVPIHIRGHVVGEITAHKSSGTGQWTAAETDLMRTLVEQLDVALENARLYQETQRRAVREQQLREIGAHKQGTVDLDAILRTAVEDLARTLNVPSAFVQLYEGRHGSGG
jgi:GAF domain-containing protein